MTEKRRRVIPTVFCALVKNGSVLMIRRKNTGWMDGMYDLPAGHLHDQEQFKVGAIRELVEEVGVTAQPEDLKLIHIYQNHNYPPQPHYGHVFVVSRWEGEPQNLEPDKCDDVRFFELKKLPPNVTPYVREALKNIDADEVTLSFWAQGSLQV